jgi:DNA ligase-associated putative exonuclease
LTLLRRTDRGLWCEAGDFYVDPWAAVDRALVTHAHGDHVAWGCRAYLTAEPGVPILRQRLDPGVSIRGVAYGTPVDVGGVRVSLHPAGHILGSAQVRLEHGGEVWVASGDYKTEADPTCAAYESVRCHTFITECTFGLPVYRWQPSAAVFDQIHAWWRGNQAAGKATLLFGYALGKAQRLLAGLDPAVGPILTHGAVERMTEIYRAAGVALPATTHAALADRAEFRRALILAPPSADGSAWARRWDGIRAQLIRRAGRSFLWSRGEELLNGRFPEVEEAGALLPEGTVLDGELLPWVDDAPLAFAQMQRRIGRKTLGRKILTEVPVVLVAFDLLEEGGEDLRDRPLVERRARLGALLAHTGLAGRLVLSPAVAWRDWPDIVAARARARETGAEGLMLKRSASVYGVGRRRGDWWKWKVDPLSVDAVLIYAQPGSGRRAGLFTDYTFGIWDGDRLVPFAKAYSGLTDDESRRVDAFVRRNTLEKFGPVRTVRPELVFELAFEGIQRSTRHKSGVAVRFPRMARWRTDKRPEDADTLETVRALIPAEDGP